MLSSANPVGSAAAMTMVMIQPRTVRNFVHSARSSRANRSRGPALSVRPVRAKSYHDAASASAALNSTASRVSSR